MGIKAATRIGKKFIHNDFKCEKIKRIGEYRKNNGVGQGYGPGYLARTSFFHILVYFRIMKTRAAITAIGGYVPEYRLTNTELETMVETSDQWIRERTGILERRILKGGRATSDMCIEAIQNLFSKTDCKPEEIELIICASVTPDHVFPATANIVADRIGAVNAWGFDIEAACSGFLYALRTGSQFIETGVHKKVLVVGADMMSSIINYEDRNTCIIFGDGGGAVLLEPNEAG